RRRRGARVRRRRHPGVRGERPPRRRGGARPARAALTRGGGGMSVAAPEPLIATGPVLLELDGAVARLRLNRPEASNGLNVPMLRGLFDEVMRCHADPRARAVLLSGEGAHFCAGGDVREFASKGERLPASVREATTWLQASAS